MGRRGRSKSTSMTTRSEGASTVRKGNAHTRLAHGTAANSIRLSQRKPLAFTKWCPKPGPMPSDVVRRGVQERLDSLASSLPPLGVLSLDRRRSAS